MTFPAGAQQFQQQQQPQQQPPQQQQPAQQQPHPTVPYGQPGFQQPAQQSAPSQPFPGWQQPAQQQPQQPWGGFSTDNLPPAPGTQPQQQQQQQQQPQNQPPAGINPNQIIQAGPGVPPELVGRTMGQAFQIYTALANDWLGRNGQQTQRQQQQTQQQQQQPPAAQPGQPATQLDQASREFWSNPPAAIRAIVGEMLQNSPATQAAQRDSVAAAARTAAAGVPDFGHLWPEIQTIVAQADPGTLVDPRVWEGAADIARGRLMRAGRYNPQAGGQPPAPLNPNAGFQAAGGMPTVPAQQNPQLPQFAFFTEAPTPPSNGYGGNQQQLTPKEMEAAQKFGMSAEEYQAWKGGVQRGR